MDFLSLPEWVREAQRTPECEISGAAQGVFGEGLESGGKFSPQKGGVFAFFFF